MPKRPTQKMSEFISLGGGERGRGGYSSDGEADFSPSGDLVECVRGKRENQDGEDELCNSNGKNPRGISDSRMTSHIKDQKL